jgi:hypothetical protein
MKRPGSKKNLLVSFSGGRTSAYMCMMLKKHCTHLYNFCFVFANTGAEQEDTLRFVNDVDKLLGLGLVWVESEPAAGRGTTTHRVVTYETAARNGEPFEKVIKKYGVPSLQARHCTRELKINPIDSFGNVFFDGQLYRTAIGIRADEERRVSPVAQEGRGVIYPLAETWPTTKQEVIDYWAGSPIDLKIPEFLGNCRGCFHKSEKKLMVSRAADPKTFSFFSAMERKYPNAGPDSTRRIYRGYRTAGMMEKLYTIVVAGAEGAVAGLNDEDSGSCSETCEAV